MSEINTLYCVTPRGEVRTLNLMILRHRKCIEAKDLLLNSFFEDVILPVSRKLMQKQKKNSNHTETDTCRETGENILP